MSFALGSIWVPRLEHIYIQNEHERDEDFLQASRGRIGEGVVIARLPGGGWSGPSAIGTGGAGLGFQVGGALSVAAGPVGRAAEAGILPVAAVYT